MPKILTKVTPKIVNYGPIANVRQGLKGLRVQTFKIACHERIFFPLILTVNIGTRVNLLTLFLR